MTDPILVVDSLDDDRPTRPDPSDDSLRSAQFRRYWRELISNTQDDNNNTRN